MLCPSHCQMGWAADVRHCCRPTRKYLTSHVLLKMVEMTRKRRSPRHGVTALAGTDNCEFGFLGYSHHEKILIGQLSARCASSVVSKVPTREDKCDEDLRMGGRGRVARGMCPFDGDLALSSPVVPRKPGWIKTIHLLIESQRVKRLSVRRRHRSSE
jgi:hypothetical protein